jgi:hypothetical protein
MMGAKYLYDTEAGTHVTLPATAVDDITFVEEGAVVVRVRVGGPGPGRLLLISAAGQVATLMEPAALPQQARFLRYAP